MSRLPQEANGEDNLSPGTQIISKAIVIHAMNLDINMLNVNYVKKGSQNLYINSNIPW